MTEITKIEEIQQISFNIFISFDRYCRNNNLRYTLAAGTMLGAVRHHGFIPWDDDNDAVMPRKDYLLFTQYHKLISIVC